MGLLKTIGSVTFTIWISVILMVLLVVSTSVESVYGTTYVQNAFYQSKWFDVFLSLLFINIFCATILRFPFQKRHIGFLLTHIGILGLLIGALMTRMWGVDGQMALYEGSGSDQIRLAGYQVEITLPDKEEAALDLRPGRNVVPDELLPAGVDVSLTALNRATEAVKVIPGGENSPENAGVEVEVQSRDLDVNKTFWLTEKHPHEKQPSSAMVGPAQFLLTEPKPASAGTETPVLHVLSEDGKRVAEVRLDDQPPEEIALTDGMTLKNIHYYAHARVMDGKVVDHPAGGPLNPAVEFDVTGPQGERHFLKFAYFPDFGSMHGKAEQQNIGLTFRFDAPEMEENEMHSDGMAVRIEAHPDGSYQYTVKRSGINLSGPVVPEEWVETGWADLKFRVLRALDRADFKTEVVNSPNSKQGVFAVELKVNENGKETSQWMTEGPKAGYRTEDGDLLAFRVMSRTQEVPFVLRLKDFRKIDYPGTSRAAAFESDVVLADEQKGVELKQTISMNRPLDYGGFRIFQSSYVEGTQRGEGSIFTVARSPGTVFIYVSSCSIFLGAFYQFYGRRLWNKNGKNGGNGQ